MNSAVRLFLASMVATLNVQAEDTQRYRGDYSYGHEVNSFCPLSNSQCYWIGAGTDGAARARLLDIVTEQTTELYEAICVIIEGEIDRESPRDGFAADFDGLIHVSRVYGICEDSTFVTQGDLQHHRWLLESVNGDVIVPEVYDHLVPELDFGERMHVAGNTGCNRFTGTGVLRDTYFNVEGMASTRRSCVPHQNELEQTVLRVLSQDSIILLDSKRELTLEMPGAKLTFRLHDWVQ